jgi:hypothetical protein
MQRKIVFAIVAVIIILLGVAAFIGLKGKETGMLNTMRSSSSNSDDTLTGYNNLVLTNENGELNHISFPKGMIMIWFGSQADIPKGWAWCNGDDNTPDLRGIFVMGSNPASKKNANIPAYENNKLGGSQKLQPKHLPQHTHKYKDTIASFPQGAWDRYYINPKLGDVYTSENNPEGRKDHNELGASLTDKNGRWGHVDRDTIKCNDCSGENFRPIHFSMMYIMKL